jgi:molybdate/tungstate transport system substrate-binding protein
MKKISLLILIAVFVLSACGGGEKEKAEILVLHAGSLSIPFKDMANAFMAKYPEVEVKLEAHGSRTAARQISDLQRSADVMGSADSAVIRNLLMPEHAGFCVDFTTNEMVLMHTEHSKAADEITGDNWYEILLRDEVQFGHSDPNADPCGYRAILSQKLAEIHYGQTGLYQRLKDGMPEKNIRPKETDLIAMLEAGELDYIFIYRSVAEQHKARYVVLPDEVNLKSADFKELYGTVSVQISGKKPGEFLEKKGAPMVYGITLPKNATHPEWGARFIEFVLDREGRTIMAENGQPEIIPPRVDVPEELPENLKRFFEEQK